jgi:hypothetical protein
LADYDLSGSDAAAVFITMPPGLKIRMKDGTLTEIIENPGDGAVLQVKVLESEDAARVGEVELIFFIDIKGVE